MNTLLKPRILVVEDEQIVAMDIKRHLGKLGYDVCGTASKGEDALKLAEQVRPDLVLMDIRLQGEMDGITAAQALHDNQQIPVVYLTAHADESTFQRAKVTEPYGYILKPFEPVELRVAIELALDRSSRAKENYLPQLSVEPAEATRDSKRGSASAKISDVNSFEHRELITKLRKFPEFANLSDELLANLVERASLRDCAAGEVLAFEGDVRNVGFLTLSGRVALFKTSLSGRELIVELLVPGEVLGLALGLEREAFNYSVRAQIDSQVLVVQRSSISHFLEKNPSWYRRFLELLSQRLSQSHGRSRGLAHDRVEVRIASSLLRLVPDSNLADSNKAEVRVTRKELAEIAGTTVETSIRVTKAMERDGLLDLPENGLVKIEDLEGLQAFSESEHD